MAIITEMLPNGVAKSHGSKQIRVRAIEYGFAVLEIGKFRMQVLQAELEDILKDLEYRRREL
jgi:hypothetical protein